MKYVVARRAVAVTVLCLAMVACKREAATPTTATAPGTTPEAAATAAAVPEVELKDVAETTPDYVIGISYQTPAAKYPGLAAELKRYADAARTDLIEAAQARKKGEGSAPYDLSLNFTEVLDSPSLVAVAAEGSSYTGGAHGSPLIARFVWLPQQNKLLRATDLVPDKKGWDAISRYVREQLHSALSQRVDADDLAPAERAEVVENAGRMIDDGTGADPANFALFEPVVAVDGKMTALRFVFPPYEVGPYSDGTQTVEVPASVLLPFVAPAYKTLFAGASNE
ncbi:MULTISPECIES: DUF3298 and DUF4163 domain-containing protein [unclassified Lysobacter]|uniref:DUF3298 and DUF4163 domain-containing protein n=1 Tax=unclassified Lysobacter TaxID=2635362 RepID=UPI0006FDBF21|nr:MULTISPECIES: DUF3298 and DUF4163 domain-containing protein [unclassified Lysobacter]KQZ57564.1 hypothetical protein ASD53_07995 [Lysobacter sp. Root559]KRC33712.1 hypothetical protein ASE10_12155 [Lysobacter sp. Root76]KRD69049.1 hypothetical protein ASE45_07605 [Lysobacter sp. Root96]